VPIAVTETSAYNTVALVDYSGRFIEFVASGSLKRASGKDFSMVELCNESQVMPSVKARRRENPEKQSAVKLFDRRTKSTG